jgi:uncharacterized protein (DUF2164 family)
MTELDKKTRADAIASLQRYFHDNLPEPIGDLPAGMLLDFFLEELGPVIYNLAITDAQTRLLRNVSDLTGDLYEKPFSYWPRLDAKRKARR